MPKTIKNLLVKIILSLQQFKPYRIVLKKILYKNIEFKVLDSEKNQCKFIATQNNKIIASAYLIYLEDALRPGWWMWSLAVKVLYRRMGIGKGLLKRRIELAKKNKAPKLYCRAHKDNLGSLRLHEEVGLSIIPGSEKFDEKSGHTFVDMQMDLNGHEN